VQLTPEEQAWLSGEGGPGLRKAMEIIAALGKIFGAQDTVPVHSVQISGVSYKNLGEAGLEFLQEWAEQGARTRVPVTLNPAGMDLVDWRKLGISEEFARQQLAVIDALTAIGAVPTCSCTPYFIYQGPSADEHLAWSESSAVSYANSVLGARTNREGGPSALAAAITGCTARYGLHLRENRRADTLVEIRCPVVSEADFGVLGYLVGRQSGVSIPYFRGLDLEPLDGEGRPETRDRLRALGAAMAASGAVALYHVEGVTPEARRADVLREQAQRLRIESLVDGYTALNTTPLAEIDMVSIGCPHSSGDELRDVADRLRGKRVATRLWVTTARKTKEQVLEAVEGIEQAGGLVVADTCLVVAPIEALGVRRLATNSAKAAFYAPGHSHAEVRFGTLDQCLEAAVTGRWPGDTSGRV
jgi:predicted aconitase